MLIKCWKWNLLATWRTLRKFNALEEFNAVIDKT